MDAGLHNIATIVLNYCSAANVLQCIRALESAGVVRKDIIVVDNASPDNSGPLLSRECAGITFIQSEENLGYAGGNNLGIRRALADGYRYVFILNPDTCIRPGALKSLLAAAERDPHVGALGCVTIDRERNVVQYYALNLDRSEGWSIKLKGGGQEVGSIQTLPELIASDYVGGSSLFLSAEAIRQCGTLDERFFLYWEETELCTRFLGAGYSVANVRDAVAERGGLTFPRPYNLYYMTRNVFLFNALQHERAPIAKLLLRQARVLGGILRARDDQWWPYIRASVLALFDVVMKRWGKTDHRVN